MLDIFAAFAVCVPFCAAPPPPLLRGRGGRAWVLTAAAVHAGEVADVAVALTAAARDKELPAWPYWHKELPAGGAVSGVSSTDGSGNELRRGA
jgi:hypothetical protein